MSNIRDQNKLIPEDVLFQSLNTLEKIMLISNLKMLLKDKLVEKSCLITKIF